MNRYGSPSAGKENGVMDNDISVETAVNEINSFVTEDMRVNYASATSTAMGKLITNYGVNGKREDEHSLKGEYFEHVSTKRFKFVRTQVFTLKVRRPRSCC